MTSAPAVRLNKNPPFAETRYQAKSWNKKRRVCPRIEATTKGLDIRFVATSIHTGAAQHVYETLYCARGQAENLIKLHKAQIVLGSRYPAAFARPRAGRRSPAPW
jgi:Transposase DDE domain group 1